MFLVKRGVYPLPLLYAGGGLKRTCPRQRENLLNWSGTNMKTKKPDIFLVITMCMLVLAAVLCIVILFVQKRSSQPASTDTNNTTLQTQNTGDTGSSGNPVVVDPSGSSSTEQVTPPQPVDVKDIDQAGLEAELKDALSGLNSEWQVMVIDPVKDVRVSSTSSSKIKVDDWMTANRMAQVYIMGAVFQQVKDGTLVLDAVLEDVKAMITKNDTYAADRLTEQLGGGDAAKGRDAVKAFATDNGVQLGFNRPLSSSTGKKNYVNAKQNAEILNKICRGELVSQDASRQMLDILLTPAENPEIDPGITGENVKFGFVTDVEEKTCICSMGIVQLQNRSYVISMVCNEPYTTNGAKNKIIQLIGITHKYFAE